jgi:phytoene synthase
MTLDSIGGDYAPWASTVDECRREFVRVARTFLIIPELIPFVARNDIALLYCFCRRLDDAIDEAESPERARAALVRCRDELSGREARRPLISAFLAGVPRNGLPLDCVDYLLEGMEMDLGAVRVSDDDALLRYAYRVSAAVGLMLAPLFGIRGVAGEHCVIDLGLGLQLSNILFGVADDAHRGRVYLPATRLTAVGLTADDVLRDPSDHRLLPVLQGVAALADRYYRSGLAGVAVVPLRYRHGALLLGRVYAALGRRAARGEGTVTTPAMLPLREKAFHLAGLFANAWSPRTLGLLPAPPHDPMLHRALAGLRGAHTTLESWEPMPVLPR